MWLVIHVTQYRSSKETVSFIIQEGNDKEWYSESLFITYYKMSIDSYQYLKARRIKTRKYSATRANPEKNT